MVKTPPILSKVVQVEDNAKKNTKFFSFCMVKFSTTVLAEGQNKPMDMGKRITFAPITYVAAVDEADEDINITIATLPLTETNMAEMTSAVISWFETENANSEMNMANHDFCISSRRPDSEWLAAGLQTAGGWMGVMEKLTARAEKLTARAEKLTARAEKQKKEQGISGKIPTYPL